MTVIRLTEGDIPPIEGDVGERHRGFNSRPSIYRPTAVVKFTFRLEEFNDTNGLDGNLRSQESTSTASSSPQPTTRATVAQQIGEVSSQLINLQLRQATTPGTQFQRERADLRRQLRALTEQLADAPSSTPPALVSGAPPDDRRVTLQFIPTNISLERNGLKTADTCEITCNATDVPFDPRAMRAAAVEVTIGIIDPAAYEDGVRGARNPDGSLRSQVQPTPQINTPSDLGRLPPGPRAPQTTRFVGVVDTFETVLAEDGDTITMQCRDFTALFLDTPLATGSGIDLTLPIDQGVQKFVNEYVTTQDIRVNMAPGATSVVPGHSISAVRVARRGRNHRRLRAGDQKMNLWDQITEVCHAVGLVPIVRDYEILLVGRTFYQGGPVVPRRMVYGRNLTHLEFTRKLSGVKVPTIEVRSYDPILGRSRWARYPTRPGIPSSGVFGTTNPPAQPTRANETSVSGATPDERIQTYLLPGITSAAMLEDVARQVFENIGRQEIEGNFETHDVQSFEPDGPVDGTDLLEIDTGDPVELLTVGERGAPLPDGALTAATLAELSIEGRTEYLQRLGYAPDVARRYAELQQATAFQTVFRIQNARIGYDVDEGINITADFQNFVTVREESHDATSSDTSATQESTDGRVESTLGRRRDPAAARARDLVRQRRLLNRMRSLGGGSSPLDFATRQAGLDDELRRSVDDSELGIGEGLPPDEDQDA